LPLSFDVLRDNRRLQCFGAECIEIGRAARTMPSSMPCFCNYGSMKLGSHCHLRLPCTIRSSPIDTFEQHR
jgi:hypothetical protein